jgi:hypothetical protein
MRVVLAKNVQWIAHDPDYYSFGQWAAVRGCAASGHK